MEGSTRTARFDAVVVGSGPAGATAAYVLARGGARVALVDKATFPRDKACGDLIGPRGVAVLDDLGLRPPDALICQDMVVVGPTGNLARLPCPKGTTYPSTILAVTRMIFDAYLREAAIEAGASPVDARVRGVNDREVVLSDGRTIEGDAVVGADGASSAVAEGAGLVDPRTVLRAFAVRAYIPDEVSEPHIVFWEPTKRRGFPGYGWLFPGPKGQANVGLGAAAPASTRPARELGAFLEHLRRIGVLRSRHDPEVVRGGWLKMGMIGTIPAAGRVLLAGDAAGLVNPLQGEGISEALVSGRYAAESILNATDPAASYRRWVCETYGPFQSGGAAMHRRLLGRPRTVAALSRALVVAARSRALAGAWSMFWNDLIDGAWPGSSRTLASVVTRGSSAVAGQERRWLAHATKP
jgi:menaquinone-9 beta-reductase